MRRFESMLQDVRYAARTLIRRPSFASLAVLTLALGISLNVTVFAVLEGVVIRALPYRDADRIVMLWVSVPKKGIEKDWTSYPTLIDWKRASRTLENFAIHLRQDTATVVREEPKHVDVGRVSAALFPLLGVHPILGRTYTEQEEERRDPVVVISHGYWTQEFGGSDVIGKTILIDEKTATIIGVMPASFAFPSELTQIWMPLTYIRQWPAFLEARQSDGFRAVAKLMPGVTLDQARSDLSAVAGGLAEKYPDTDANKAVNVVPLAEEITQPAVRRALWLMMLAVFLVLMVACGNVAALFLARSSAQRGELAVRVALGAGARRLLQLKLSEAVLVSMAAGFLALGLTAGFLQIITAYFPADLPRSDDIRINPQVMLFAFAVSLLSSVLAGLAPAWSASHASPITAIRGSSTRGQSRPFGRRLLVGAQFGLTTLLMVGAALLALSYWKLQNVDIGFRPDNVLLAPIVLPGWFSGAVQDAPAYFDSVIQAVASEAGVESAAAVSNVFSSYVPNSTITVEGRPPQDSIPNGYSIVSGDYFRVMEIPLIRGRNFNQYDGSNTPGVAIVNRTMANRLWAGRDPLGQRFRFGVPGENPQYWLTIVGVVGDTSPNGPESQPGAHFYLPLRQRPHFGSMEVVVRTSSVNPQVMDGVRRAIRSVSQHVPRSEITTVESRLNQLGARRRANTLLLAVFSALSIALASVGLYALVHFSVVRRTREIGIRMALGAQPSGVMRMILWEGIALASIGMAAGLVGAIFLAQFLSRYLYGVGAHDPATFAGVIATMLLIVIAACAVPASRAARMAPAIALKYD